MSNQEGLVRYKGSDRLNHWLIAILFVLATQLVYLLVLG